MGPRTDSFFVGINVCHGDVVGQVGTSSQVPFLYRNSRFVRLTPASGIGGADATGVNNTDTIFCSGVQVNGVLRHSPSSRAQAASHGFRRSRPAHLLRLPEGCRCSEQWRHRRRAKRFYRPMAPCNSSPFSVSAKAEQQMLGCCRLLPVRPGFSRDHRRRRLAP